MAAATEAGPRCHRQLLKGGKTKAESKWLPVHVLSRFAYPDPLYNLS
jgi:hypothetical protein